MRSNLRIYSAKDIDSLDWPDSETGRLGKAYLLPLLRHSVSKYIRNVETTLLVLRIDDHILPLTVNDAEWSNSYVCSPYTQYITYAREEIAKLRNRPLELLLGGLLSMIGWMLRSAVINKVVMVNNWLFSTNIYPELSDAQLRGIVSLLRKRFPDYAILFRSIDTYRSSPLLNDLRREGLRAIGSRKVYFWDPTVSLNTNRARRHWRGDESVLRQTQYRQLTAMQLERSTSPRLKALYDLLYIQKYSRCNPQFTEDFFALMQQQRVFHIRALKHQSIDGMSLSFCLSGVLVTPIVGYDTSLPKKRGLYRLLMLDALREARASGLIFHASSGVGDFKLNRGSIGAIEYSLVLHNHLPWMRRLPWRILELVVNRIAVPLLQRMQL